MLRNQVKKILFKQCDFVLVEGHKETQIPKIMIAFAIILSAILYWATSNICKYNFALDKRTKVLNIITEEMDPTLGNAKVYYYEELNCNNVDLSWDLNRIVENFQTLSVIIYQALSTDIKGNPI